MPRAWRARAPTVLRSQGTTSRDVKGGVTVAVAVNVKVRVKVIVEDDVERGRPVGAAFWSAIVSIDNKLGTQAPGRAV